MRFILVAASFVFLSNSAFADHLLEGGAKCGFWWQSVPNHKKQSVINVYVSFLGLTANEQLEVFYYNEDKTFEAWRMCDWLSIHNKL